MTKGNVTVAITKDRLIHALNPFNAKERETKSSGSLNLREVEFLKLACTEMTYKEIAGKMFLSVRTIDGYRDSLFVKLDVKSRVGLVLYAIKHDIVRVEKE
jgi:DNA-binding CsgD family transcriptional regulator